MKIEEMTDVFLNLANFAPHAFLTLAPPSGYALNLKALIKVSKVSWTSQILYEILRSSFERKFDKTNFISPKRTPQNNPGLLGNFECILPSHLFAFSNGVTKLVSKKVLISTKFLLCRSDPMSDLWHSKVRKLFIYQNVLRPWVLPLREEQTLNKHCPGLFPSNQQVRPTKIKNCVLVN